jgi:hypothetical protein
MTDPAMSGELAKEAREALKVAMADSGYARCASWATGYGIRVLNALDRLATPPQAKGEAETEIEALREEVADLRAKLGRAEAHMAATGSISAAWKRGLMCAIEWIDTIAQPKCPKKYAPGRVEQIKWTLDKLTDFARENSPATYQEAFQLSEDFNGRARAALDKGK